MMKNQDQVCGTVQSNINQSKCSTHNENGTLCIKWPSTIQLTCLMNDSEQILDGNIFFYKLNFLTQEMKPHFI